MCERFQRTSVRKESEEATPCVHRRPFEPTARDTYRAAQLPVTCGVTTCHGDTKLHGASETLVDTQPPVVTTCNGDSDLHSVAAILSDLKSLSVTTCHGDAKSRSVTMQAYQVLGCQSGTSFGLQSTSGFCGQSQRLYSSAASSYSAICAEGRNPGSLLWVR